MSDQEIVVTSSDQTSDAARESKSDTTAAPEQPKPKAGKEPEPKAEARDAADDGDDGEDTQNETGESADPGNDEPAKPKNRGVGKRIDELTKARYDAERERDHWRELAMRQNQPQKEPQKEPDAPAAAPDDDPEPTLESCDYDDSRRMREWYEWRRRQDKKVETKQAQAQKFAEREAAFRAEHPDYDAVARNPAVPITQQVAEIIIETDDPPAIAYYLGQNIAEAAAIAQMTPHQIGRAIGRIEAKLSAPPAAEATPRQPAPKTVTQAPPPVTTLSGSPAINKSLQDAATQEEYEQMRRDQRKAKGLRP